eukprot:scaffold35486_cov47-Prasinocladus_malaysianus.AAC.1
MLGLGNQQSTLARHEQASVTGSREICRCRIGLRIRRTPLWSASDIELREQQAFTCPIDAAAAVTQKLDKH